MRVPLSALILVLAVASNVHAQVQCGPQPADVPPDVQQRIKGDVEGKAQLFTKLLGDAGLKGTVDASKTEIYQKYADLNKAQIDHYMIWVSCQNIMLSPSLSPLERTKLWIEIYRELNARTSDKDGNNGLPRDDARFGTMLGWQLARYEFAYDSPLAEAKAAAPSMRRDIVQLLKSDNAAGLFNNDFHVMTENVLSHYLTVKPTKHDAILIGICALRSSLVGASKDPESNREIAQVAFSAIQDVDSTVISDKAAFFQKLQKTHPRNASELMDFLTSVGIVR